MKTAVSNLKIAVSNIKIAVRNIKTAVSHIRTAVSNEKQTIWNPRPFPNCPPTSMVATSGPRVSTLRSLPWRWRQNVPWTCGYLSLARYGNTQYHAVRSSTLAPETWNNRETGPHFWDRLATGEGGGGGGGTVEWGEVLCHIFVHARPHSQHSSDLHHVFIQKNCFPTLQKRASIQAHCRSAGQEMHRTVRDPKVHYRVRSSLLLNPITGQFNQVHAAFSTWFTMRSKVAQVTQWANSVLMFQQVNTTYILSTF
jgi:hypothetical protein